MKYALLLFPTPIQASSFLLLTLMQSLSLEIAVKAPKIRLSLLIASFIRTPLTMPFESSLGKAPFITPLLHVDTAGDAIVDTLYSGEGRDIYIPGLMRYVAGIVSFACRIDCSVRHINFVEPYLIPTFEEDAHTDYVLTERLASVAAMHYPEHDAKGPFG